MYDYDDLDDEMRMFLDRENFLAYKENEMLNDNGITSANLNGNSSYSITTTSKSAIYNVSDSFLQVCGYISTNSTGTAYIPENTGYKIALQNSGWRLWNQAKFDIADTNVEQINNPGEIHQAVGLTRYDRDFEYGQGKLVGWAPDRGTGITYTDATGNIIDSYITPAIGLQAVNVTTGVSLTLAGTGAADQVFTMSAGGTAGNRIDFLWDNRPVQVVRTTEAGVSTNVNLVVATTSTTAVNYFADGAATTDVISFWVDGKRLRIYGYNGTEASINISAAADTGTLRFNNGVDTAVTAGNIYGVLDEDSFYENSGFEMRRQRGVKGRGFNTGQAIEFYMPLRDIFKSIRDNPMPMRGQTLSLKLQLNSAQNYLYSNDAAGALLANAQFYFTRLSWWIPSIVYKSEISTRFLSYFNQPHSYEYYGYQSLISGESFSGTSGSWKFATGDLSYRRVYIYFQKTTRLNSRTKNNDLYDNLGLTNIYLEVGTHEFPSKRYDISYAQDSTENYFRAYHRYLDACELAHSPKYQPAINDTEFRDLYPMYVFNINPRNQEELDDFKSAEMSVFWQMTNTDSDSFKVFAIWEIPKKLIVDTAKGDIVEIKT
jgi:hypothetical protein